MERTNTVDSVQMVEEHGKARQSPTTSVRQIHWREGKNHRYEYQADIILFVDNFHSEQETQTLTAITADFEGGANGSERGTGTRS